MLAHLITDQVTNHLPPPVSKPQSSPLKPSHRWSGYLGGPLESLLRWLWHSMDSSQHGLKGHFPGKMPVWMSTTIYKDRRGLPPVNSEDFLASFARPARLGKAWPQGPGWWTHRCSKWNNKEHDRGATMTHTYTYIYIILIRLKIVPSLDVLIELNVQGVGRRDSCPIPPQWVGWHALISFFLNSFKKHLESNPNLCNKNNFNR